MEERTSSAVTLETFSARVGCHFTTASRLRAGERRPSPTTLKRIVSEYGLDREKAFNAFTAGPEAFGAFLREFVFDTEVAADDTEEDNQSDEPALAR